MEYENKLVRLLNLDVIRNGKDLELYSPRGLVGKIEVILENNEKYYQTTINYNGFNFFKKRNVNEKDYNYKFYFQDNDNRISMEMDLGSTPYLTLYNEDIGVMSFSVTDKELSLTFKTILDKGSVLENLRVRLDTKSNLHAYLGDYYSYNAIVTKNNSKKHYELCSYANNDYDKVIIVNNSLGKETRSLVKGSIRDTIRLDEHGKDALDRFQTYINNLFPFNIDFLRVFLEERGIKNDAFIELYPNLKIVNDYYAIREINNNTLLGIRLSEVPLPLKSYGTIICNLNEIYDFGYLNGFGDYSGSYVWNNDYIFRVSNDLKVESVFDIKNKKIIDDMEEVKKIYQEYYGSKELVK